MSATPVVPGSARRALADAQAAFAALATDVEAVARVRDSGPGSDAAASLQGIDLSRLHTYARSLRWKRMREARRLLPLLSQAMGAAFGGAFLSYASRVATSGTRRPLADAMAFARDVARSAANARPVREAARFEWHALSLTYRLTAVPSGAAGVVAVRRRGPRVRLCRFDYEFPAEACFWPLPRRTTVVLFVSGLGRCGLWYW